MRYRVTIRGEGTEIRGYATEEVVLALADASNSYVVVASQVDDDYDPFGKED